MDGTPRSRVAGRRAFVQVSIFRMKSFLSGEKIRNRRG
jgi:hypothetical protein